MFESLLATGIGGTIGILAAALALGIRHGIDWDHIAAITDITSTAAVAPGSDDWLTREPAVMLTDESHHQMLAVSGAGVAAAAAVPVAGRHAHTIEEFGHRHPASSNGHVAARVEEFVRRQRPALVLGTMYALGHGIVVVILGTIALVASQFLPAWIDPIMERVVGATLVLLAAYLFFSLFQYFRGGGEFRLRSRWMLVFAGVRNGYSMLRARLFGRPHEHVHEAQQYGMRTSFSVGLIHGVGAETGTQALVIATAVGAGSRGMGVAALTAFVVGLLISNSMVTVISTAGFVSSQRRQWIYVGAGMIAAVFSLFVGLFFLTEQGSLLPDLGHYFRWIGGPSE